MRMMGLPVGFGKKPSSNSVTTKKTVVEQQRVKEPSQRVEEEEEKAEEEDQQDHEYEVLPISSFADMSDHSKTVTSLSIDPSASRFVTGSRDNTVKLWDFNSMTQSLRPFKTIVPAEGSPVRDVQFNLSGSAFLVAPSTAQPRLYDRDGSLKTEFAKGDPYLRDLRHTSGHISALTAVRWHPFDPTLFITAALDGTIRLWDVEKRQSQKNVICVKSKPGVARNSVTAACFSLDGKLIAASASDGALYLWSSNGPFISPSICVPKAHCASSLVFSRDNRHFVTRGLTDGTVKLWDLRNNKSAVATASGLDSYFEETSCIFSPNERHLVTGCSADMGQSEGCLAILDSTTLGIVNKVPIPGSIVRVFWPDKLNQIFCGTSTGSVRVLYDETESVAGIKIPMGKQRRKLAVDDYEAVLGMTTVDPEEFENSKSYRLERKKALDNASKRKPHSTGPIHGPGKGGHIGTNLTNIMMKNIIRDTKRDEDPREALLKLAEETEADPYWIAPAYKDTQPKPVLSEAVYEDELEKIIEERKKRRK